MLEIGRVSCFKTPQNPFILSAREASQREMFSDNIMSYRLHTIVSDVIACSDSTDYYVFDSTLLCMLCGPDRGETPIEQICATRGSFMKRSMLIDRKYVIMVANIRASHWVFYIIHEPYSPKRTAPVMYIFDSLFAGTSRNVEVHAANLLKLKAFFECHAARYGHPDACFDASRGFCFVKVDVQQEGALECGAYVTRYIRQAIGCRDALIEDAEAELSVPTYRDRRALLGKTRE